MYQYILITPARNEAKYILKVIKSVTMQTIQPRKWIIVNDNSTDGTEHIVSEASKDFRFIKLISISGSKKRSFGSKAFAFQMGYNAIGKPPFDFIGNLDADITFDPYYYESIIDKMNKNPRLGVSSGVLLERRGRLFKRVNFNLNHAVGGIQLWRKDCYEAVGGYKPVTIGGIDSLAELTARMKGWETRSFPDLPIYHHKPVDSANVKTKLLIAYRAGLTEFHIGTYPLFALLKAIKNWNAHPVIISVFIRIFGYGRLWLLRTKRDATKELVDFLKKEQKLRMRDAILSRIMRKKSISNLLL